MKHVTRRALALLLLVATLLATACQGPADSPDGTQGGTTEATAHGGADTDEPETNPNDQEDPVKPPRDTYRDLSFDIPEHVAPEETVIKITASGDKTSSDVELDFTAINGMYIVSSTAIPNCHDSGSCDICGYADTEGEGGYLLSSHGEDQGGMTVTLATPIPAVAVTGMEATFKTTANASASQLRILAGGETKNAAFINSCGSMADAVDDWRTVDLGVADFTKLADKDGYIRSFQIYFRNKNKCDCFLKSLRITVSPQEYLTVTEIEGSFLFEQAAARAIGEIIAKRFEFSGVQAEITVETDKYRSNSSKMPGGIYYVATATLADGTTLSGKGNVTVPAITGEWLNSTQGSYGSTHDSKGQWQDTFDNGGLVLLTDNILTCAEGVRTVEYAVIPEDGVYNDPTVVWLRPHLLEMSDKGFGKLFVNAYLDYADALTEGGKYRLLLRGVSNNDNYILHLDVPFTYSPLSAEANAALTAAHTAIRGAVFTVAEDVTDKQTAVKAKLEELISNDRITVNTELVGVGVNSVRVRATLAYNAPVTAARLPEYVIDGTAMNTVYAFEGAAFAVNGMTVPYDDRTADIILETPYDGDPAVILASKHIQDFANATLKEIEDEDYDYVAGEYCTPAPVLLSWKSTEGKTYTVTVSKSSDLTDPVRTLTVTGSSAEVYNLNVGQQYYWQVTAEGERSLVYTFRTAEGYPRFIKAEGISNLRDLGGYTTVEGLKVRQDLAYRSAHLDTVTEAGLKTALEELGIKTDLDIRGGGSAPLGSTVNHISIAMQWYSHIFTEANYEVVRRTVATFAYEENYPILFHCSMGRDRTGTTAILVLGLLGVDEETLRREYYASYFSQEANFNPTEFKLQIGNLNGLFNGLSEFGGKDATLKEQIEDYLLTVGVTKAEIESIREILLEGYEPTVTPVGPSPEPDEPENSEPETEEPETSEPETSEPPVIEAPFDEIPYTETVTSSHSEGYGYSPYEVYTSAEEALAAGIPEGFEGSVMKLTDEGDYVGLGMDLTAWKIPVDKVKSLTVRYMTDVTKGELRLSNGLHFVVQTAIPETNTWVEYTVCDDGMGFRNDYRFPHITNEDGTLGYFILYIRNKSGVPGTFYVDSITVELKE